MKKKLKEEANKKKELMAISKMQSLVRSFLFVKKLKWQMYKTRLKKDAARIIIKIVRYLNERSLDRRTKKKAAIMI